MIPRDFITEWRDAAPWVEDGQVEQDLVISRALVQIFAHAGLRDKLAFRGGTALYKLYIHPPARYSEDIDLVQLHPEPIGETLTSLRSVLDHWLGEPQRKQNEGRVTLNYRFRSEQGAPLRLKIEINTREHVSVMGLATIPFAVESRWHTGKAPVTTYHLDELLGTKMRALYQRKKGRDLFDLATAISRSSPKPQIIVETFLEYMSRTGSSISRALFERNLAEKMKAGNFHSDIRPLLAHGTEWDADTAARIVFERLLVLLPGDPWKGEAG